MITTRETITSTGPVPHRLHPSGRFLMPVVLNVRPTNRGGPQEPLIVNGRYIYALPGGGRTHGTTLVGGK